MTILRTAILAALARSAPMARVIARVTAEGFEAGAVRAELAAMQAAGLIESTVKVTTTGDRTCPIESRLEMLRLTTAGRKAPAA